jgi:hypothetical protein
LLPREEGFAARNCVPGIGLITKLGKLFDGALVAISDCIAQGMGMALSGGEVTRGKARVSDYL